MLIALELVVIVLFLSIMRRMCHSPVFCSNTFKRKVKPEYIAIIVALLAMFAFAFIVAYYR
jgi:hypothetical protein